MRGLILLACCLGACAIKIDALKPKGEKKADAKKAAAKYVGTLSPEERANLPKFFWHSEIASKDQDGFSWGSYRWGLDSPGFRNHPAKVNNAKDAKYVIMCCLEDKTKEQFLKLPKREADRPYLVKTLQGSKGVQEVLQKREDFVAVNYDLRDSIDKQSAPLRGITLAPHNYYNGKRQKIDSPREFFVTFQGRKTSKLRHELHDAFNNHRRYKFYKNISVETVMDRMWNVNQQTGDFKFNKKMNTTYVLLPKGDDRWSLRFSETIGAGAIPVILADGLTLPYEDIIDWSNAAIRLPNGYAQNADDIMKHLPSDEKTIMKLRQSVYDINRKYFANPDVRADALLLEADAFLKKGEKYEPIWHPELAEPWLEDAREGATEESKAIAAPLAKKLKPTVMPAYLRTKESNETVAKTLVKRN